LLCDPAPEGWDDIVAGEDALERMQWNDVSAVYHAHSSWQGVVGRDAFNDHVDAASRNRIEDLRELRGEPPPHFVRRSDAHQRIMLAVPSLDGEFFAALRARRMAQVQAGLLP
jgi:hypothetical protein